MRPLSEKLSAKQNAIIYCMQQGWDLIASKDCSEVTCCSKEGQFNFSLTIFWNLYSKGLIYQEYETNDYVLTPKGKEIKTKSWDTTPVNHKNKTNEPRTNTNG